MRYLLSSLLLLLLWQPTPLAAQHNHNFETAKHLDIFNALYKELDLYYVDTLDTEKTVGNAIAAMLDQLDPYTEYYKEESTDELRTLTTGKYAGIGSPIVYRKSCDRCVFDGPYAAMPAAKAGVRTGDIIIAIDDTPIAPCGKTPVMDYTSGITQQLRGDAGTTLRLRVERPTVGEMEFTIERQAIKRPSVLHHQMLNDSTGYILLDGYTEDTSRDLKDAIVALRHQGMRRFVFDLRSNPGGLMDQAIKVVSNFIPKGSEVLHTAGKTPDMNKTYCTETEPIDTTMPMAVLVDYGTASAAEITSGALQDYDRAVIIGRRTYGKGLVQAPRPLPYGAMLKLTTAKYFIPSGRCIQAYDFAHRGSDGQPKHLPDSLCKTFHTAAGRPVRDGGGITPDVTVHLDTLPSLVAYLQVSDQLFDWCVRYRNTHATIASPADFHLSEADFCDFRDYLAASDFTYDVRSRHVLDMLRSVIREEGYGDEAKAELDALAQKLQHDTAADVMRFRKEVTEAVEAALISNYYGEEGLVAYTLRSDPDITEALRILTDDGAYTDKLSPKP